MYKAALTTGLLLATWVLPAVAIDVTTVNTATFPTLSASTVTTAGRYYNDYTPITSITPSTVSVTGVTTTPTPKTWKLYAKLTTAATGLTVQVTNTASGSGCTVTSNSSQTLATTNKLIFSCSSAGATATAVPLQFQLTVDPTYGSGSKTFSVTYEAIED